MRIERDAWSVVVGERGCLGTNRDGYGVQRVARPKRRRAVGHSLRFGSDCGRGRASHSVAGSPKSSSTVIIIASHTGPERPCGARAAADGAGGGEAFMTEAVVPGDGVMTVGAGRWAARDGGAKVRLGTVGLREECPGPLTADVDGSTRITAPGKAAHRAG